MKTCTKCKIEKQANTEHFNRDKNKKDGLHSWCKDCVGEDRKQRKAKYKEKIFIYDDKTMKTCNKCKIENPATPEYFNRDIKMKDGLFNTCKDCDREYREQRRARNEKKKFIYDDKIMKTCIKCKMEEPATLEYFHKDIRSEDGLVNECKECRKEYSEKHYQKNREEILEYSRKYYKENREYHLEFMKKYSLENPEVDRLKVQRRRARIAQLPYTLTVREWEEALEYFNNECAYCGVQENNLQQEHVIPVIKGGGYTQDNIIPACGTCNASKNARDLEEWYVSYEHYDEDRLNKVLDYVKNMEEM